MIHCYERQYTKGVQISDMSYNVLKNMLLKKLYYVIIQIEHIF